MKRLIISLLSAVCIIISLAGCDGKVAPAGPDETGETPTPLVLDPSFAQIFVADYEVVRRIHIVSGNGGYEIVYPKRIEVGWGTNFTTDYETGIFDISIDDINDDIVIQRENLPDEWVYGRFMVRDAKGQRRIFTVMTLVVVGGILGQDEWDEFEQRLLNDPDYWQE